MRVTRTRPATLMPWLLLLALCLLPALAFAAPGAPTTPLPDINVGKIGGAPVSLPLQTLLLMTAITLIPSMLLVLTSFTRIIIVLACCARHWVPARRRPTRCCWAWPCSSPRW